MACAGLCLSLLLGACSTPPPEEKTQLPPVLVGKISKVFPQQNFVLIQQEKTVPVPAKDTVLLSQGASGERISNLVMSAERLPNSPHYPADIRSGYPAVGDFVFLYESLENGKQGVSVLVPTEDGSITKPGEIKFPALENPEDEIKQADIDNAIKDADKLPQ